METLRKLLPRLRESSTYAGFGVVAMALFGWTDAQWSAAVAAVIALAGVVAVFVPEKGSSE